MDIIKSIEHEQLKNKIPELKVGNTVKVHVRIKEGNKERRKSKESFKKSEEKTSKEILRRR